RARDDVVVSGNKLGEVHAVGVLDIRDFQRARAVFGRDVDGETNVHVISHDAERLAAILRESMVQRQIRFHGFHDGPGDDVREAQLVAALQSALAVDGIAVFFDDANRNLTLRSGDRNGQTRGHVFCDAGGGAAQRDKLIGGSDGFRFRFRGKLGGLGYLGGTGRSGRLRLHCRTRFLGRGGGRGGFAAWGFGLQRLAFGWYSLRRFLAGWLGNVTAGRFGNITCHGCLGNNRSAQVRRRSITSRRRFAVF